MTPDERRSALEAIASEVRVCDRCRLASGRTRAVPGEGHPDTEVIFVGEGPGQREDEQGRPFVGAAGSLLGELLGLVGWKRDEVFITNVVKCRPPGNRDPEPDEIEACRPYLQRQLEVLDPALVVTLGRFSLQTFMPGSRISQAHGTERPVDSATGARAARAYAMYHPAAALRQQSLKVTMARDMAGIPDALIRARTAREGTAATGSMAGDATPTETPATAPPEVRQAPHVASSTPVDPSPSLPIAPEGGSDVPDSQLGLFR